MRIYLSCNKTPTTSLNMDPSSSAQWLPGCKLEVVTLSGETITGLVYTWDQASGLLVLRALPLLFYFTAA
jgi:hypothetical protein